MLAGFGFVYSAGRDRPGSNPAARLTGSAQQVAVGRALKPGGMAAVHLVRANGNDILPQTQQVVLNAGHAGRSGSSSCKSE